MRNFIKKYRFIIQLVLGGACFFFTIKLFFVWLDFIYAGFGDFKLVVVFGLAFVIRGLWGLAYGFQDDAWYWLRYKNTGDDYEHRYCECCCVKRSQDNIKK